MLLILAQLLLAVEYLHHNNTVHRDIKSANIFIEADTSSEAHRPFHSRLPSGYIA